MGQNIRIETLKNGRGTELPRDIEKMVIYTQVGGIYIDLTEQVENMILMRSTSFEGGPGDTRLILSPMDAGRIAVGVIRTPDR